MLRKKGKKERRKKETRQDEEQDEEAEAGLAVRDDRVVMDECITLPPRLESNGSFLKSVQSSTTRRNIEGED